MASEMNAEIALNLLARMIQECGYKALVDKTFIRTGASGLNALVFYSHQSGTMQFYCGFSEHVHDAFGLSEANKVNDSYKFVKCIIKDNTTVAFECDFLFRVDQAGAQDHLRDILSMWDAALNLGVADLRRSKGIASA